MSDSSHASASRQAEAGLAAAEARRATSAPSSPKQKQQAEPTAEETLELARRVAENLRKESAITKLKECDEVSYSLSLSLSLAFQALILYTL